MKQLSFRPGHYWLEVSLARPTKRHDLAEAMRQIGFSSVRFEPHELATSGNVLRGVGAPVANPPLTPQEAERANRAAPFIAPLTGEELLRCARVDRGAASPLYLVPPSIVAKKDPRSRHRLVVALKKELSVQNHELLQWDAALALGFDPEEPFQFQTRPATLKRGKHYTLRFLARDRALKSSGDVATRLEAMGFAGSKVFLLKREMHVPARIGTMVSSWIGAGVWARQDAMTSETDAVFFDRVAESALVKVAA